MQDLELTYLKSLSKQFPTIADAATEIINLQAILSLPKGTEHFLTDIHGEYEQFNHVLKNGSGSVKRKIDEEFGNTLSSRDKRSLATLIYYPMEKLELVMQQASVTPDICPAVSAALLKAETTGGPAGAMVLPDGRVVTGKTTDLMGASSATLLNALKRLAGIDHQHHLISREAIEPIQTVKVKHLGSANPRLHSDETLIALAISATTNPLAAKALAHLDQLRSCEAHSSVILSPADSGTYAKLGMRLTCEPTYETNKLYHKGS